MLDRLIIIEFYTLLRVSPYLGFQGYILYLKIQNKIDLGARIDPSNNCTPISAYMNQKMGFKSLEIHTLLKMEGNNALSTGQPQNNT